MSEQKRLTFEDTKQAQKELLNVLHLILIENKSLKEALKPQQEQPTEEQPKPSLKKHFDFYDLVADALLSGCKTLIDIQVISNEYRGVVLLGSIIEVAIRLENTQDNRYITKTWEEKTITIPIIDVWNTFYNNVIKLFALALEEALHSSKETSLEKIHGIQPSKFKPREKTHGTNIIKAEPN